MMATTDWRSLFIQACDILYDVAWQAVHGIKECSACGMQRMTLGDETVSVELAPHAEDCEVGRLIAIAAVAAQERLAEFEATKAGRRPRSERPTGEPPA